MLRRLFDYLKVIGTKAFTGIVVPEIKIYREIKSWYPDLLFAALNECLAFFRRYMYKTGDDSRSWFLF